MPVRLVPVSPGNPIKLDKPVLLIGRNPGCDVILKQSRKVSRTHCLIACVNNTVLIRDLGSTNGVWINSQRVERDARLRLGDELSVADVRYHLVRVEQSNGLKEAPNDEFQRDGSQKDAASGANQRLRKRPVPGPLGAEQNVPIAIPDEEDSFMVEASSPRLPRISPQDLAADLEQKNNARQHNRPGSDAPILLHDDGSDDVIPLGLAEPLEVEDSQDEIPNAIPLFDDNSGDDRPIIPLDD
ncbi:MAG: FHA domain-containing protein [Planctomycetota bacterium]|nr:FHA domain-containing protein [Planctomycetota bacterium]